MSDNNKATIGLIAACNLAKTIIEKFQETGAMPDAEMLYLARDILSAAIKYADGGAA